MVNDFVALDLKNTTQNICNLICFSPPCFFHYSAEHLMELLTLPDVPSYSVVEVGWMGVAWVELLVAKRPMMSQQGD